MGSPSRSRSPDAWLSRRRCNVSSCDPVSVIPDGVLDAGVIISSVCCVATRASATNCIARRKSRVAGLGPARFARAFASSSRVACSNSCQNFVDVRFAFPIARQTPNMMAQLSSDRNASMPSTICVAKVALSTRSNGVEGTAPRACATELAKRITESGGGRRESQNRAAVTSLLPRATRTTRTSRRDRGRV